MYDVKLMERSIMSHEYSHHLQYRTPLTKLVWREMAGSMYTPMRIGYALISIKVNLVILYLIYKLATSAPIPMVSTVM